MTTRKAKFKKVLQWVLKVSLSIFALYLVYKKIDHQLFLAIVKNVDWIWLIPAFLLFNISKVFSAIRLKGLLNNIGIKINHQENLQLYYQGMFYNLFLPGGIGGDAFKTYVLNKGNEIPLKKIIGTILYDRISGLIVLVSIASLFAFITLTEFKILFVLLLIGSVPVGYLFTLLIFPSHKKNYLQSQFYSLAVQLSQVLSVILILKALQIKFILYFNYLFLFMISSIASVIPVTIGGAGARELVFLYGEKIMNTSIESGIAVGLLFFLITAVSSFAGIIMKPKLNS
jgi:uncharacterized membrane protein YbhN (UPF0104 family)